MKKKFCEDVYPFNLVKELIHDDWIEMKSTWPEELFWSYIESIFENITPVFDELKKSGVRGEIIEMKFQKGYSIEKIKKSLGIGEEEIRKHLRLSFSKLRNHINQSFEFKLEYPYNLMLEIFGKSEWSKAKDSLPEDFFACLEYVLASITQREKEVIIMRYRDNMTLEKIAKCYDVTKEVVRQNKMKAIRRMSQEKYLDLLRYGLDTLVKKYTKKAIKDFKNSLKGITSDDNSNERDEKINMLIQDDSIEDLNLSVRVKNCLLRSGIKYIYEIPRNKYALLEIKNLGEKGIEEIFDKLRVYELEN